jgi:hypothetical protein
MARAEPARMPEISSGLSGIPLARAVFEPELDRELADATRRGLVVDADYERGIRRWMRLGIDVAATVAVMALAATLISVLRPPLDMVFRLFLVHLHLAQTAP